MKSNAFLQVSWFSFVSYPCFYGRYTEGNSSFHNESQKASPLYLFFICIFNFNDFRRMQNSSNRTQNMNKIFISVYKYVYFQQTEIHLNIFCLSFCESQAHINRSSLKISAQTSVQYISVPDQRKSISFWYCFSTYIYLNMKIVNENEETIENISNLML